MDGKLWNGMVGKVVGKVIGKVVSSGWWVVESLIRMVGMYICMDGLMDGWMDERVDYLGR